MNNAADVIGLVLASALLMTGAGVAVAASSVVRRLIGVLVALLAAVLAAAALGSSQAVVVAAVAITFAYCALGVGVLVRLQEAYGATETGEIDSADDATERAEPSA